MEKHGPIGACGGGWKLYAGRAIHELGSTGQLSRHRTLRLPPHPRLPQTTPERLCRNSCSGAKSRGTVETVLYLAYGSNLCVATFRDARGIKPLSATNVVVPSLSLTFDLSGLPYTEPCFANTAKRQADPTGRPTPTGNARWDNGLVGVVYEVTVADYAHIIQTEGSGASYEDILVDCYPLSPNPAEPVPREPTGKPFMAHTLFAPALPDNEALFLPSALGRVPRPNPPGYAQPSARYLDLIQTGAAENSLPNDYQRYLEQLKPYTITTRRQKMGKYIFSVTWGPILALVFTLMQTGVFNDRDGIAPGWLIKLLEAIFNGIWWSYDHVLKGRFGDGERTEGDELEEIAGHLETTMKETNWLLPRGRAAQRDTSPDPGSEKRVFSLV